MTPSEAAELNAAEEPVAMEADVGTAAGGAGVPPLQEQLRRSSSDASSGRSSGDWGRYVEAQLLICWQER